LRHRGFVFAFAGLIFAASACTTQPTSSGGASATATPVPTALPDVAPVAAQTLPAWIAEVSPKGKAADGAQIRIRFASEVAPLEALDDPATASVLSHVTIEPSLPGRFVLLTPKMIGFEADAPIPHAARVKITLQAGLADLKGHTLANDYAWTFTTEPIAISGLPGENEDGTAMDARSLDPVELTPTIPVTANAPVEIDSLLAHASVIPQTAGASPIPLVIKPKPTSAPENAPDAEPIPGRDPGDLSQIYELVPSTPLSLDTTYTIAIAPGVRPIGGNLPAPASAQGVLRTYGAFRFVGLTHDSTDSLAGGTPRLDFSNGLDESTVLAAVSMSPSPPPGVTAFRSGASSILINSVALAPRTTYTFKIAPTLKDRFGQTLGTPASATFTTGDELLNIWAPTGLSLFPAVSNLKLDVDTTNLKDAGFYFASRPIQPIELVETDLNNADADTLLGAPTLRPVATKKNVDITTTIPVAKELGAPTGTLAYRVTEQKQKMPDSDGNLVWKGAEAAGFVELTNLGVFSQWFPNNGIVRVHHLADGHPVANANVTVYESISDDDAATRASLRSAARIPCASGTTDATGTLHLDGPAFAKCASTATNNQAPSLLVIAREGADWAWTRSQEYGNDYFDDVYVGWSSGPPVDYGTVATDRSLYQPGESLRLTAVAYFDENGVLARGRAGSFKVQVSDPDGKSTTVGSHALDQYGTLSMSYTIPKSAKLGYYSISVDGGNGEVISGGFRVAEFRPPNFTVALAVPNAYVVAGSSTTASVKSTYNFGAPVEGATTRVTVTRAQGFVQPKGWDAFAFGREWDWPDQPPSVSPDVSQRDIKTDTDGNVSDDIPIDSDIPYPMTYTVDADTTDVANLSVADTKTFTAIPSAQLIGIKSDFVAQAGTPFTVSVIVTDPDGAAQTGKSVHLVLQKRDDVTATQLDEGSETERQAVHYTDVASTDVTSGDKAVDAQLTAPKPGSYRIVANYPDAKGPGSETDRFLWVSGAGETSWFGRDPNHVTIKLDKQKYAPGETATALIQSPYDEAEVYLAVIRHGVMFQTTRVVHGAAPQISFPVTPDMLPNAAVEAVVVRRGPSLARGIPNGLDKLAKVGMTPLHVALDGKYLKLVATPKIPRVLPGGTQHVDFALTDAKGKPVAGEVVVAVVNDAILQLTGYRYPDLVPIVYSDQPISERFADNRFLVQLMQQHKFVDKGFGYGGGASAAAGSTRVRTKFEPLAYFNGSVIAGADGKASVDFTLPDDLTTWRVLAMALTTDARFGTVDSTFIASKPLVTEAILPQFARPGDRFSAGVAVTDIAKTGGNVQIAGTLGSGLGFGDPSKPEATTSLQAPVAGLTSAYRFDVTAFGTSETTVKFATTLGPNSDAFQVALPMRTQDVTEDVVETGTTKTAASIPLTVDAALPDRIGGLTISLASTLLPDAFAIVKRLGEDPFPFANSVASRLGIASDAIVLDRLYGKSSEIPALRKEVARDLTDLRALVNGDGGYVPYPGGKHSELYVTAFAATQLEQAKRAGFDVDADIARVKTYLAARLADPGDDQCDQKDTACRTEARLEALETLGTLGDYRADYLDDITAATDLSYYERVELARHMIHVPVWHDRGVELRDKLLEQVYETGRRASLNDAASGESEAAGEGQVIGMMLDSGLPADRVDRVFTSLLALSRNGTWGCLCDDAEAMNAITAYARSQGPPPDFDATASLGSLVAARGSFHGYAKTSITNVTPMHALPRGKQSLALAKTGPGTLHYAVDLTYGIAGDAPGRYQGIRIDRFVRNAGSPTIIATFGTGKPTAPTLDPGRVYEIEDRITTDHQLENVIVTDPLPAGLEAVDTSLLTSDNAYAASAQSWQLDYQQFYRDRVLSYGSHLDAGTYAIRYLVRSVTPGTFAWPAATATLQYAPDEFGRTSQTTLTISPLK
jgi:uncharacterized protein YfaS (alpha-2-macroglobulin family)